MKRNQAGFTLIELVMVIVILGVLAAVALPKFVDLKGDAQKAAIQGAAGALSSLSSINYATAQARGVTGADVIRISSGVAAAAALTAGMASWDATNFKIQADTNCGASAGVAVTATLSYAGTAAASAIATIICTG